MYVRVEAYAGHRGDEAPQRLYFGARAVGVVEILDRWQGPDHRYFKVRGDDRAEYLLRHDLEKDVWELTGFKRGVPG